MIKTYTINNSLVVKLVLETIISEWKKEIIEVIIGLNVLRMSNSNSCWTFPRLGIKWLF